MSLRWRAGFVAPGGDLRGCWYSTDDFHAGELRSGTSFGGVVEEDQRQRVSGILRANELRERHGDFFAE